MCIYVFVQFPLSLILNKLSILSIGKYNRKDDRKGLLVRGCTGPRTTNRANTAGNLPHASGYWREIVVYTEC